MQILNLLMKQQIRLIADNLSSTRCKDSSVWQYQFSKQKAIQRSVKLNDIPGSVSSAHFDETKRKTERIPMILPHNNKYNVDKTDMMYRRISLRIYLLREDRQSKVRGMKTIRFKQCMTVMVCEKRNWIA